MGAEPTQFFVTSQRISISCWDWGNPTAPPLVLVHGGRDHARSWDRTAEAFRDNYHVVAFDLRGHGDSGWSPGGNYGLPDNALDIVRVIETVGSPARVISHSYGASCSLLAAGTYPEHFAALVAIEGTHSLNPAGEESVGPGWVRKWGDRLRAFETQESQPYATIEAAARRMKENNPRLPDDVLADLVNYAAKPVDGGFMWKYDLWVNGRNSMEIRKAELPSFWEAIACPVLHVNGTDSNAGRRLHPNPLPHFKSARVVEIADAGHWIHHDQPAALQAAIREFFAETD